METVTAMWGLLQSTASTLWSIPYLGDPLMKQDLQFVESEGKAVQERDWGENSLPLWDPSPQPQGKQPCRHLLVFGQPYSLLPLCGGCCLGRLSSRERKNTELTHYSPGHWAAAQYSSLSQDQWHCHPWHKFLLTETNFWSICLAVCCVS